MKTSKRKPKAKPAAESPKPRTVFLTEFQCSGCINETSVHYSPWAGEDGKRLGVLTFYGTSDGGFTAHKDCKITFPASQANIIHAGQTLQITVKVFET